MAIQAVRFHYFCVNVERLDTDNNLHFNLSFLPCLQQGVNFLLHFLDFLYD
jgi:hypothetical protein